MLHVLYSIGVLSSHPYFTFTSLSFDREIHRLFCVIGVFSRPNQNSKEMNKVILNKISWKQTKLEMKHFLDPSRKSLLEFPAALLLPWMRVSGAKGEIFKFHVCREASNMSYMWELDSWNIFLLLYPKWITTWTIHLHNFEHKISQLTEASVWSSTRKWVSFKHTPQKLHAASFVRRVQLGISIPPKKLETFHQSYSFGYLYNGLL